MTAVAPAAVRSLSFQPPGLVTYDFFCSHQEGRHHLLYLQRRRVPDGLLRLTWWDGIGAHRTA